MADIKITLPADVSSDNPVVGDLYLDNGTIRLTNSLQEAVAQELWIRFHFFKGEWFLDDTQGVPYLQTIFNQKLSLSQLNHIFQQIITKCPGVSSLISFSLARDTKARTLTIDFVCQVADGTILKSSDFGPFTIEG